MIKAGEVIREALVRRLKSEASLLGRRLGYPVGVRCNNEWLTETHRASIPGFASIRILPMRACQKLEPPQILGESEPSRLWEWALSWTPNPQYAVTLKNWRLWNPGWLISPDRRIELNITPLWNFDFKQFNEIRCVLKRPKQLGGRSLCLSTDYFNNYFHWMLDMLPKLLVVRDAGYQLHDFDHVIVNSQMHEFQRESLLRMGVRPEQITCLDVANNLIVDEMVVPSMAEQSGIFAREYIDKMNQLLVPADTSNYDQPQRVFVVRSKQKGRSLANEPEVIKLVKRHGFKCIDLDGLTLERQIQLFKSASVVIAVHGAALTNLLFCKKRTRVLEILPDGFFHQMYFYLARMRDLDYSCLISKSLEKTVKKQFAEIIVDIKLLEDFILN